MIYEIISDFRRREGGEGAIGTHRTPDNEARFGIVEEISEKWIGLGFCCQ